MINKKNIILRGITFFLYAGFIIFWILYPDVVNSGPYLDSAHGSSSYGVNRTSISTFGYSTANCAHCHEQHAMISGGEPAPSGGPDNYALFYDNHINQTDNFCFKCHTDLSSLQTGGLVNRSYSYRAGGYTSDTLNDILEAFSFTSPRSSHNLDNIVTFITSESWGYTADSNPCAACHNPHRGQGDPANAPNSAKTSDTRGWPVSRPSQHSTDNNVWELWGDGTGEKMSDYASGLRYQSPYRYNSTVTYEPDGSLTTQDGSNLTDYATFCQDCHSSSMSGAPYNLSNTPIDWTTNGDKHGKRAANATSGNYIDIDDPYSNTYGGQYVLSCTDCHEPHGAPNLMLIRKEVNGALLAGTISTLAAPTAECPDATVAGNKELGYLCNRCHKDDADAGIGAAGNWCYVHHESTDRPYSLSNCGNCHTGGMSFTPETPILMSNRTHRPIGEIKAGDKVLSFDFDNNTICESEVIEVSNHFVNETLEINGVRATSGHLFAVGRDQWVEAGNLKTGDTVLVLAGHGDGLEKIILENPTLTRHPEKVEVVGITLKGTQNFFVIGKENKFLVHNMGGMDCSDSRDPINCNCCHYHLAIDPYGGSGRRTF